MHIYEVFMQKNDLKLDFNPYVKIELEAKFILKLYVINKQRIAPL